MEKPLILKEIPNLNMSKIKAQKLKIKMDMMMLDSIIGFIYKESALRTRKTLVNIWKLFNMLDEKMYEDNIDLKVRIWVIMTTLDARLNKGYENEGIVIQYCTNQVDCDGLCENIFNNIEKYKKGISHEESRYLVKAIDDRLEFGYTVALKDAYQSILDKIDAGDFKSYKAVSEDLYDISTSLINIKRNTNSLDSDETFSLREEKFENCVTECVQKLKDRNRIFVTGVKRWNTMLAPGYQSKRLYMYLALPGGGKSAIMLKSALDIRKYNQGIKTKDPDKNPAILLITMENSVDETVERIFNMTVTNDDIRNYTPKQIIKKLKEEGELKLTEENNIDLIIKYYPNRSIDTNDLYSIIKDLYDDGEEVIALVLDYVKRIKPAEKASNEKEELKNITNELKTLAKILDIVVISAQQLNRGAASVVDAAIQAKKEDITRLVGRDGIAGAWEIIENADWVCIVNQEMKQDTEELYMTFKMLKRRYRSTDENEKMRRLDYFNHPYEKGNDIKLVDDIDMEKSVSLYSLSSTFVSYDEAKRGKKNAVDRKGKEEEIVEELEFEPFDFGKSIN